jgi:AcrR family transcriptional regulator
MHNYDHPTSDKPRDRRRIKLQAEIRRQAYKLFARQGYAKTSVEQIAAAADISYSTFFRHFPSKQAIAGDLRLDGFFIEAFDSLPPNIPLSKAILAAARALPDKLTPADVAEMREHYSLLMQIPELQATGFAYLNSTARAVAESIKARLKPSTDNELAVQTLAWSIVASWVAAFHYWQTHPDQDLSSIVYNALRGAARSAEELSTEAPME